VIDVARLAKDVAMQTHDLAGGLLWFNGRVRERCGVRSLLAELEAVVRRLRLHPGVSAAAVSSGWLRQYDAESGKRGDDP
jgi:hypothetical protein